MSIKNPIVAKILIKLLRLKTLKVQFIYEKEIFDSELTRLAFFNKVKMEFDEQSEKFREQLDKAIEEASR